MKYHQPMKVEPVDFLKNEKVYSLIKNTSPYFKKIPTLLRVPDENEFGKTLTTYVYDHSKKEIRVEAQMVIGRGSLVARNQIPLANKNGEVVWNEWVIPEDYIERLFGKIQAGDNFKPFFKTAPTHVIELTPEIMKLLGVQGNELHIKFKEEVPLIAHLGDYLSLDGYPISKDDFHKTYL